MKGFHEWLGENYYPEHDEDFKYWVEYLEPAEMAYMLIFLCEKGMVDTFDLQIGDDDFEFWVGYHEKGDPDIAVFVKGTYSMDREEASFQGSYELPPDSDSYNLENVDIDEVELWIDGDDDRKIVDTPCVDMETLKVILQRIIIDKIEFDEDNADRYKGTPASERIPPCMMQRIEEVREQNKRNISIKKMKHRFNL